MATTIGDQLIYTVGELIDELRGFKTNQLVFIIGHEKGEFFQKPFYKIEENADETEIYLYAGDNVANQPGGLTSASS